MRVPALLAVIVLGTLNPAAAGSGGIAIDPAARDFQRPLSR